MKKLELKGLQMLSKEQMKKIGGGYICYALTSTGGWGAEGSIDADNCCMAQGIADATAYSNGGSAAFPYGIDCPCDEDCDL